MRLMQTDREQIANTADDALSRFGRLDLKSVTLDDARNASAEAVEHLMGCDFFLLAELPDAVIKGHGYLDPENLSAAELAAAVLPVDKAVICRKDEQKCWVMQRFVAPIPPAEVRGRTRIVPPIIGRLYSGWLNDDGTWWAEENIMGLVGGTWQNLEAGIVRTIRVKGGTKLQEKWNAPDGAYNCALLCSMALTSRYDWHVAFGGHKNYEGPRVLLPTNPAGCLTLLRDREKGETNRRAALRHWVSQHYRERTETDLDFVRQHLRGHTEFSWRGLDGELLVSAHDLEKNEFFKRQTDEWRAMRKHNRVRVRLKKRSGEQQ